MQSYWLPDPNPWRRATRIVMTIGPSYNRQNCLLPEGTILEDLQKLFEPIRLVDLNDGYLKLDRIVDRYPIFRLIPDDAAREAERELAATLAEGNEMEREGAKQEAEEEAAQAEAAGLAGERRGAGSRPAHR